MTRTRALRLLIGLVVLVVLLAIADRVSAVIAEKAAANYLDKQAQFATTPSVTIHGVPFLTQAARGRYNDIEVHSGEVRLDSVTASDFDVHLRGVHLTISDALGGSIHQLPCDSIDGTVTFSYAELVSLSNIPGLALADANGRLQATATLPIPGVGTAATVDAVVSIQVVSGAVRLEVSQLSVTGVTLPAAEVSALSATLSTPIPIPALPFGLTLDSVMATAAGVVIHGSGTHVVLSATG